MKLIDSALASMPPIIVPAKSTSDPPAAPTPDNAPRFLAVLGLALATGLLLALASPPASWACLAWIALVPLSLLLVTAGDTLSASVAAWLGASVLHLASTSWLLELTDPQATARWLLLAEVVSLYWVAMALAARALLRRWRLPLVFLLPLVWTAMEFARARLGILPGYAPYPWVELAQTQVGWVTLAQMADVGGVFALTFVIAGVNGAIADAILGMMRREPHWLGRAARSIAIAGVMLAAALGYGAARLADRSSAAHSEITVALVPTVVPDERSGASGAGARTTGQHSLAADLWVWPECAARGSSVSLAPDVSPESVEASSVGALWKNWRDNLRKAEPQLAVLARRSGAPLVIGLMRYEFTADRYGRYNSSVAMEADGSLAGFHDKGFLVPWGEYTPLGLFNSVSEARLPHEGDLEFGRDRNTLVVSVGPDHQPVRLVVPICYEICFPQMIRGCLHRVLDQPEPTLIANIGREAHRSKTYLPEIMLAHARFRAIEARRPVVRATTGGYSAIIDGNGRVLDSLRDGDPEETRTILVGRVPLDDRFSFYMYAGDWLPIGCCVVTGALLVWPRRKGGRGADRSGVGGGDDCR